MDTAGYEYTGKELIDVVVRPLFIGAIPRGVRLIFTDGSGSVKETFFSGLGHNLMPYADGFQGGKAATKVQKKFDLGEFKSENTWNKQDYLAIVQRESAVMKAAFQNDIFKADFFNRFTPKFAEALQRLTPEIMFLTLAELKIQQDGLDIGIFNNFWLADTEKVTFSGDGSTTTFPNNAVYDKYDPDLRFNVINGVWKNIEDNASTTPTLDQVAKVVMSNGAVAQIATITLTGTGGTANVLVKGVTKLATFATSLTQTAIDFVAAYAADYLVRDIIVTESTGDIIFTSAKKGLPFDAPTILNVAPNLAGTVAATLANTKAAALASDEAMGKMDEMIDAQPTAMAAIDASKKVFWATETWIRNYEKTLGTDGTDSSTSESARTVLQDGIKQLKFNGIPVLKMPIGSALAAYYENYSPHRCILSIPENLVLILSSAGKFGESALWWEKKDNANLTRSQLEFGANFFLPELMVAAFQG